MALKVSDGVDASLDVVLELPSLFDKICPLLRVLRLSSPGTYCSGLRETSHDTLTDSLPNGPGIKGRGAAFAGPVKKRGKWAGQPRSRIAAGCCRCGVAGVCAPAIRRCHGCSAIIQQPIGL